MDESSAGQAAENEPSAGQAAGSGSSAGQAAGSGSSAGQAAGSGSSTGQAAGSAAKGQSAEQSPNRSFKTSMNITLSSDKRRKSSELSEGAESEDVFTDADEDFVMVGAQEKPVEEISENSPAEGPKLSKRQRKNKNKKTSSESKPPEAGSASKKPESKPKETARKSETSEKSAKGSSKKQNKADKQKPSDSNSQGTTSPTKKQEGNLEKLGKGIAESGTQAMDDSSASNVTCDRKGSQSKDVAKEGDTANVTKADDNGNLEEPAKSKVVYESDSSQHQSNATEQSVNPEPMETEESQANRCQSNSNFSSSEVDLGIKERTCTVPQQESNEGQSAQTMEDEAGRTTKDNLNNRVSSVDSPTETENSEDTKEKDVNDAAKERSPSTDDDKNGNVGDQNKSENKDDNEKKASYAAVCAEGSNPTNSPVTRAQTAAEKKGKKIPVRFYVVVPIEEFHYKDDAKVVVRFDKLGGWNSNQYALQEIREVNKKEKLFLFGIVISMDVALLNGPLYYKYVVVRSKKDARIEFIGEYSGVKLNRRLNVLKEKLEKDGEWIQYDGIMLPEPEKKNMLQNAWESMTNFFKKKSDLTMIAGRAMLPEWSELNIAYKKGVVERCGEQFVEKVMQVCYGVGPCFRREDNSVDEYKLRQMLADYILEEMKRWPSESQCGNMETEAQGGIRLAKACSIAYLVHRYRLLWDKEHTDRLLTALLIRPNTQQKCCGDYDQLTNLYFPTEEWQKALATSLLSCVVNLLRKDRYAATIQLNWLFALPLIHLLNKRSHLYCYPSHITVPHDHVTGEWWGIGDKDLKEIINIFKEHIHFKHVDYATSYYLQWLGPLFGVDHLMPRTLLSVMSVEHLPSMVNCEMFPIDALLANCCYFVKEATAYFVDKEMFHILDRLLSLLQNLNLCSGSTVRYELKPEESIEYLRSQHNATHSIFLTLTDKCYISTYRIFVVSVKMVLAAISNLKAFLEFSVDAERIQNNVLAERLRSEIDNNFKSLLTNLLAWLNKRLPASILVAYSTLSNRPLKFELELYTELLEIQIDDVRISERWQEYLKKFIDGRLAKLEEEEKVNLFCMVDFVGDKLSQKLETYCSLAAFAALESQDVLQKGTFKDLFDAAENEEKAKRISHLLSTMFERAWPADAEHCNEAVLRHMLCWPSFSKFVAIFYGRQKRMELLGETCEVGLSKALSVFDDAVICLLNGHITVDTLKLLLDNADNFVEFFVTFEKNSASGCENVPESGVEGMTKADVLHLVLKWRKQELDSFTKQTNVVQQFLDCCSNLKTKCIKFLEMRVTEADSIEKFPIKAFCDPHTYSAKEAKHIELDINITFYKMSTEFMQMISEVTDCMKSKMF